MEISQFSDQINQQNQLIDRAEDQIEYGTKDLNNLQSCLSTTHDELENSRRKVNEKKLQVKSISQNLHRLIADAKPLSKEILFYRNQIKENENQQKEMEIDFKKNETNIQQYGGIIAKLLVESREDQGILRREYRSFQHYQHQIEKCRERIGELTENYQYSEENYEDLKELSNQTEKENKQLKQQYTDLTFVLQLLGQRQSILNDRLKPLYHKIHHLTKQHSDKSTSIESIHPLNEIYSS